MEEQKEEQKHYVCGGDCGGIADAPSVCGAEVCTKKGEELTECGCPDATHGKASVETPEEASSEASEEEKV